MIVLHVCIFITGCSKYEEFDLQIEESSGNI
jgi:hypothetical protein